MYEEIRKALQELYSDALDAYKANGRYDYEAGIIEGIKRAQEAVEQADR